MVIITYCQLIMLIPYFKQVSNITDAMIIPMAYYLSLKCCFTTFKHFPPELKAYARNFQNII